MQKMISSNSLVDSSVITSWIWIIWTTNKVGALFSIWLWLRSYVVNRFFSNYFNFDDIKLQILVELSTIEIEKDILHALNISIKSWLCSQTQTNISNRHHWYQRIGGILEFEMLKSQLKENWWLIETVELKMCIGSLTSVWKPNHSRIILQYQNNIQVH